MKLQEFFDSQKQTTFTDIDKLDLYQNILYKKTKKNSLKRASFMYTKYFVYSTIFVFLLVGVYGVYLFNGGDFQSNNRFSIIKNSNNTVQADYIAQVINTQGNFYIEHDGILSKTNNISNGDTILLKEDTQLAFEIDSGTQAKIIGPAKLVVQKTPNENYKLNLVYGNFIEMEGNNKKTQTIELAINDLTIKQEDKNQPMNFKFVQEGDKQIFQNNGANILVTKSNGTDKITKLSKEQVVTIQNNDIQVFANIDSFTTAIQTKNISQTFTLNQEKNEEIDQEEQEQETISLLSLLHTNTNISENKEEITKEITSILGEEKKILEPEQDKILNNSLYPDFYTSELEAITITYEEGNNEAFTSTYQKLEKRIQNIYQTIGLAYNKNSGEAKTKIEGLISDIKKLRETFTSQYNIPPTYDENLEYIEKSLTNIITKGR